MLKNNKTNKRMRLVGGLAVAALLVGGLGVGGIMTQADETGETPEQTSALSVLNSDNYSVFGASIRYKLSETDNTAGIRFHVRMDKTVFETLTADNQEITFGTLVIPTDELPEDDATTEDVDESELTLETANVENNVTYGATVEEEHWRVAEDDETKVESVVYVYGIPQESYNRNISVRGYVTLGEETVYTSDTDAYSAAEVATGAKDALPEDEYKDTRLAELEKYINTYKVTYENGNGNTTEDVKWGTQFVKAETPAADAKAGYTFVKWVEYLGGTEYAEDAYDFTQAVTVTSNLRFKAIYEANTDTAYTVKHYVQNEEGDYDVTDEPMTGTTDTQTAAVADVPTGYVLKGEVTQSTIKGDGTTVVEIYYDVAPVAMSRGVVTLPVADGATTVKLGDTTLVADSTAETFDLGAYIRENQANLDGQYMLSVIAAGVAHKVEVSVVKVSTYAQLEANAANANAFLMVQANIDASEGQWLLSNGVYSVLPTLSAVVEGNGYSFKIRKGGDYTETNAGTSGRVYDAGFIGVMEETAVLRNFVIDARYGYKDDGTVASNALYGRAGAIAYESYGLIENCYVDSMAHLNLTISSGNLSGSLFAPVYVNYGTIKGMVSTLVVTNNEANRTPTNGFGFAVSNQGKIENSVTINERTRNGDKAYYKMSSTIAKDLLSGAANWPGTWSGFLNNAILDANRTNSAVFLSLGDLYKEDGANGKAEATTTTYTDVTPATARGWLEACGSWSFALTGDVLSIKLLDTVIEQYVVPKIVEATFDAGVMSWTPKTGETSYAVTVNGEDAGTVDAPSFGLTAWLIDNSKQLSGQYVVNAYSAETGMTYTCTVELVAEADASFTGEGVVWEAMSTATSYTVKVNDEDAGTASETSFDLVTWLKANDKPLSGEYTVKAVSSDGMTYSCTVNFVQASTYAEMLTYVAMENCYVTLTADINASEGQWSVLNSKTTVISTLSAVIDGNGHKLTIRKGGNYTATNVGTSGRSRDVGFFGVIEETGALKNLVIDARYGYNDDGTVANNALYGRAGMVAYENYGLIENCYIESMAKVNADPSSSDASASLIAPVYVNYGMMRGIISSPLAFTANGSNRNAWTGFAFAVSNQGAIENSIAVSTITRNNSMLVKLSSPAVIETLTGVRCDKFQNPGSSISGWDSFHKATMLDANRTNSAIFTSFADLLSAAGVGKVEATDTTYTDVAAATVLDWFDDAWTFDADNQSVQLMGTYIFGTAPADPVVPEAGDEEGTEGEENTEPTV